MLIQGDSALLPFENETFHCVVTSPPYWGLRKYAGRQDRGLFPDLGLEESPDRFIDHLVIIFREISRVLRPDGVVWLNLGDCYAGSGGENANTGLGIGDRSGLYRSNPRKENIAQGNLMLMPHRVAIALQADGWIVRSDVVWYKRNPMPEPRFGWRWERERIEKERIIGGSKQAKDYKGSWEGPLSGGKDKVIWEYGDDYIFRRSSWRYTNAHEYVFMLTKQMQYYCNHVVMREPYTEPLNRWGGDQKSIEEDFKGDEENRMRGLHRDREMRPYEGRNPRSVLDVPTSSYPGKHFSTYPPGLIAPLIRAACPRKCCPECGQAWAPVDDKNHLLRATCDCGHDDYVPGIVLDPFVGSGTTVMVANELLRRGVGVDISLEYLDKQAKVRTKTGSPSDQFDNLPLFSGEIQNEDN